MKIKISILFLFLSLIFFNSNAQTASDVLEEAIGSVVTVAVYKNSYAKAALGFRGAIVSDIAYEKALDLSGAQGSGSGFVINRNGKKYVVTNAHVIESASEEDGSVFVFSITRKKYEVRVIGGDSFYDIAVLEFVDNPGEEFNIMAFRKDEARLGEKVYAIGNPLGEYPYTITDGIISAKNRMRGGTTGKFGFLQSTATVIWGNSGGPLVDEQGQVLGINSQIAFASTGDGDALWQSQINFALEAGISEKLVNDIIENDGFVRRAYLGIEVSESYQYYYYWGDYYLEQIDTVPVITAAIKNSPSISTLQGQVGKGILKVNGVEVRNLEEVLGEFEKIMPGQSYNLTLLSQGSVEEKTFKSAELNEKNLTEIGRHFFENNDKYVLDENSPYAKFKMVNTKGVNYYPKGFSKEKGELQKAQSSDAYTVICAGVAGDDSENMWIVENLKDFAVAIRLSALEGVIDFYAQPEYGDEDEVESFRIYLSGDEDFVKKTVWY